MFTKKIAMPLVLALVIGLAATPTFTLAFTWDYTWDDPVLYEYNFDYSGYDFGYDDYGYGGGYVDYASLYLMNNLSARYGNQQKTYQNQYAAANQVYQPTSFYQSQYQSQYQSAYQSQYQSTYQSLYQQQYPTYQPQSQYQPQSYGYGQPTAGSYGYGQQASPQAYGFSGGTPTGDTIPYINEPICDYGPGYGRASCLYHPGQPLYDYWTGTWY